MMMRNVLVPLDFSDLSEAALFYARDLARTYGARLHVMHVMENDFLRPMASNPHTHAEAMARHLADKLTDEDQRVLHAVAVTRKSDAPADEIVPVRRERADRFDRHGHSRPKGCRSLLRRERRRARGPLSALSGLDHAAPTGASGRRRRGGASAKGSIRGLTGDL